MADPRWDALIAKWATLSGTTEQKLAAVNALTVPGPNVDVPVSSVEGYLSIRGILTEMEDWRADNPTPGAARTAINELLRIVASPHVQVFAMSDPTIYAAVQGMLTVLQGVGLLTSQNVSEMMAMCTTTLFWWEAPVSLGGGGLTSTVHLNELDVAGGLT